MVNDAEGPRTEDWFKSKKLFGDGPDNMATSRREYPQPGIESPEPLVRGKHNRRIRTSPPQAPSRGVSVPELAEYQRGLTDYARWRIIVKGADTYTDPTGGQRFEEMDIAQLGKEAQDEIADLINYATMLNINIQRMIRAVTER